MNVQMTASKKHLAATVLVIWLCLITFFMILAQHVDIEIFFVLWLIGILVIVELIDPLFSIPRYIRYTKYVVAAGVVLFGIIVAQKVLEILSA